jgi:hypothetical protein
MSAAGGASRLCTSFGFARPEVLRRLGGALPSGGCCFSGDEMMLGACAALGGVAERRAGMRQGSAMSVGPQWASFQRSSHSSTNFTRSFIASVAFQGIAGLSAMSLCNGSPRVKDVVGPKCSRSTWSVPRFDLDRNEVEAIA